MTFELLLQQCAKRKLKIRKSLVLCSPGRPTRNGETHRVWKKPEYKLLYCHFAYAVKSSTHPPRSNQLDHRNAEQIDEHEKTLTLEDSEDNCKAGRETYGQLDEETDTGEDSTEGSCEENGERNKEKGGGKYSEASSEVAEGQDSDVQGCWDAYQV